MTRNSSEAGSFEAITAERDRLLEIVTALGQVSSSPATTPELMRETVQQVMHLTRAQGSVLEVADGAQLEYRAVAGTVSAYLGLRLDAASSLSGLCVARKQIMYSRDTADDPRVDAAACRKISARSMLVVPLFRGSDAIGVLKAVSSSADAFDRIDEYALSLFALFIGGVIARQAESDHSAELAADMERRALRDELTSLPNRTAWLEELARGIARARRAGTPLAVVYMDLNEFKEVNDSHGHAAGDRVLQTFSVQLRDCVRTTDFVARLSGDEFAILLEGFQDVERDVTAVAGKIIDASHAGTPWGALTLRCLPSVGIAFQTGPDYSTETLVRCADEAMYRAKNARTHFSISDCSGQRTWE
ncbi:GGDEF domain-containing protein [Pseudoxanthomonas gei]|uniref:GGDEF domain-containing protein n=1 Tax=Pseudoxanthomonas gei TaxID=1383030 RepID=A0ABX0ADG0_9GAMM|nr:sensor domain-containing diguanylate cyclase [Pseudoxanthomonas gei]NDK39597.1 GGDEF domain-containing protein [Pseudoxanthomonas gei]